MNKWCASCCDGKILVTSAEENVTSKKLKRETEVFLMSDLKNHDDETDEEASRTTQV